MGNCCPQTGESQVAHSSGGGGRTNAFQGEGHRLGTVCDTRYRDNDVVAPPTSTTMDRKDDDAPTPTVDDTLTDVERMQIRADRAAAAETRLQKQQGGSGGKKNSGTKNSGAPLRGPNSKPTMTWNAG